MNVAREGTVYFVNNFVKEEGAMTQQRIVFVEKRAKGEFVSELEAMGDSPELIADTLTKLGIADKDNNATFLLYNGTTLEELLDVSLHRLTYINQKNFSKHNDEAIKSLKLAKFWLTERKNDKQKR